MALTINMDIKDLPRAPKGRGPRKPIALEDPEQIEQVRQYKRDWYKANSDKIIAKAKEKIVCECGAIISRSTVTKHRKTQRHLQMLAVRGPIDST